MGKLRPYCSGVRVGELGHGGTWKSPCTKTQTSLGVTDMQKDAGDSWLLLRRPHTEVHAVGGEGAEGLNIIIDNGGTLLGQTASLAHECEEAKVLQVRRLRVGEQAVPSCSKHANVAMDAVDILARHCFLPYGYICLMNAVGQLKQR
jgi:hypothetical protein